VGGVHVDSVGDRLLVKLRQLAPHTVRVFDSSDEHRDVAVPQIRKRWARVIEAIEGKPWVKCELRDKKGNVLGYIENDGEAKEIESLGSGGGTAKERWFLETMLKAQETALKWRSKEHTDLMEGMRDLLQVNAHATRELVELFRVQRDVAADVAAMQATANADGEFGQVMKMIESSPQLQAALGPIVAVLAQRLLSPGTKPKPQAPKNGAPKS
jgi:hypothetical protein